MSAQEARYHCVAAESTHGEWQCQHCVAGMPAGRRNQKAERLVRTPAPWPSPLLTSERSRLTDAARLSRKVHAEATYVRHEFFLFWHDAYDLALAHNSRRSRTHREADAPAGVCVEFMEQPGVVKQICGLTKHPRQQLNEA